MGTSRASGALGRLGALAERTDARTPEDRDRYADLIRVLAILVVVYGHWIAAVILVDDGELVATQILVVEPWTRVATWVAQVMPLFFLVGGRVNADSLLRATERGQSASAWVRKRTRRLLRPLLPLLAVWLPLGPILTVAGMPEALVEEVTGAAFIPLWFLVVYLLVIVLAPLTWWAHQRLGLALLAAAVPLVVVVDMLDRADVPAVGQVNYLLVFGLAHQLGYYWAQGRLPAGLRGLHFAGAGLAVALALVAWFGYPASMVGLQADADSNATPPTLALLALTVAQLGAVLALWRPVDRWLHDRPLPWAGIATLGTVIITLFLWHMTALVVVAAATHLTGWWPEMTDVDGQWWALRPAWLALCTVALVPLVLLFRRFEGGGDPVPGRTSTTVAGVAATAGGLGVILAEGLYDPDRALGLPVAALAMLVVGLWLLGIHHPRRREPDQTPVSGSRSPESGERRR
jgi:peptidoglycan/LPS O-acetylase OafA/YrhL